MKELSSRWFHQVGINDSGGGRGLVIPKMTEVDGMIVGGCDEAGGSGEW
jgi:hypothetical protein